MDQTIDSLLKAIPAPEEVTTNLPLWACFSSQLEIEREAVLRDRQRRAFIGLEGLERSEQLAVLRQLHLKRAIQTWMAVRAALHAEVVPGERDVDHLFQRHIALYASLDACDLLLPWIKGTTAFIAAKGFGQKECSNSSYGAVIATCLGLFGESCPAIGSLGYGWVRRVCKYIMSPVHDYRSAFGQRRLRMAENVLYIKRGCPPMLPHLVKAELAAQERRLTRVKSDLLNPSLVSELTSLAYEDIKTLIGLAIIRHVENVFPVTGLVPHEVSPSPSAAYKEPRRFLGGFGEHLRIYAQERDQLPVSTFLGVPTLLSMVETEPGRVRSFHLNASEEAAFSRWSDAVTFADSHRWVNRTPICVTPYPIVEPCKCRIITAGESIPYQRVRFLQGVLWKRVSASRWHQFTGSPISLASWQAAFEGPERRNFDSVKDMIESGHSFLSGDYSAATDNIDPDMCLTACHAIGQSFVIEGNLMNETEWSRVLQMSLVGHRIVANPRKTEDGPVQTWGQLMGSPASFPILNIVNAAATAVALMVYQGLYRGRKGQELFDWVRFKAIPRIDKYLDEYCVRTNGDDLAAVIPDDSYPVWKVVVSCAGLVPSIGKNYLSKQFCLMNSELRIFVPSPRGTSGSRPYSDWRFQSFLNLPVYFGLEAKGMDAGMEVTDRLSYIDLGPLQWSLIRGIEDSRLIKARLDGFLHYHMSVVSRVPPGVDYFLPMMLGGLGWPNPSQRPGCELAMRRAAWISCLHGEEKRLKAISFPPRGPESLVDEVVKRVASSGVRKTILIVMDRTNPLPPSRFRSGSVCPAPMIFAEFGRMFDSALVDVDGEQLPAFLFSPDSKVKEGPRNGYLAAFRSFVRSNRNGPQAARLFALMQEFGVRNVGSLIPHQDVLRREREFQFKVKRQILKSMRSGLSPMSQGTLETWCPLVEVRESTYLPTRIPTWVHLEAHSDWW